MRLAKTTAALRGGTALAISAALAGGAWGFQPNEDGHLGITTAGLAAVSRTLADGTTLTFSERAVQEIRDANRDTDLGPTFFGVAEHFDDEAFLESSTRLVELREAIVAELAATAPDGPGARRLLGTALHTVQDFYSHSNWVDLNTGTPLPPIEPRLGREIFDSTSVAADLPPVATPTDATCPASPGMLAEAGLTHETTGFFPFPNPCGLEPQFVPGTPVGKCRHGVAFLCPEGINKDSPDRPGFIPAHDTAVLATIDYVNQILDDPAIATNRAAIEALMRGGAPTGGLVLAIDDAVNRGELKLFSVPIDPSIGSVTFAVTPGTVELTSPSGATTPAAAATTIAAPEPGAWTVGVRGGGHFALTVHAESPLQLDRFDLVSLVGRLGHVGFAAVTGEPAKKTRVPALARLAGNAGAATFELVTDKGKTIASAPLALGDPEAAHDERIGLIEIPTSPFRLAVRGVGPDGSPWLRMSPRLYRPR